MDINLIKQLRDRTNLSMNDCKKALEQSNSDIEKAIDLLKTWGDLKGKEKEAKIATEGKVYAFSTLKTGIFELNCSSSQMANSAEFQELLHSFYNIPGKFEDLRNYLSIKSKENILLRRNDVFENFPENSFRVCYNHPGNKLAVIVEFVVSSQLAMDALLKLESHQSFQENIAMQIAAMSPLVVSKENLPKEMIDRQNKIFESQLTAEKRPQAAWSKIIDGKFSKWKKEIVLLEQESIVSPKKSIGELLSELTSVIGGEMKISRFVRYALGEGLSN